MGEERRERQVGSVCEIGGLPLGTWLQHRGKAAKPELTCV